MQFRTRLFGEFVIKQISPDAKGGPWGDVEDTADDLFKKFPPAMAGSMDYGMRFGVMVMNILLEDALKESGIVPGEKLTKNHISDFKNYMANQFGYLNELFRITET